MFTFNLFSILLNIMKDSLCLCLLTRFLGYLHVFPLAFYHFMLLALYYTSITFASIFKIYKYE